MAKKLGMQELIKLLKKAYEKDPISVVEEARKEGLFIFDEFSLASRDHISAQQDDPYPLDFQDIFDEEQFYASQPQ